MRELLFALQCGKCPVGILSARFGNTLFENSVTCAVDSSVGVRVLLRVEINKSSVKIVQIIIN